MTRNLAAVALVTVPLAAFAPGHDAASAGRRTAGAAPYRILFTSDRDGESRAYSMLPDGSRLTPVLPAGRGIVPFAYSRDRRTMAFADGKGAVYVSRASGTGLRRIMGRGEVDGGALSYDGKLLAVDRGNGIWIVGTDGRGLRRLTKNEGDGGPSWSPDGKAIVYDHGYQDRGGDRSEIVVQPLHGKPRVLARASFDPNDEQVGQARWSPDGRWIDYVYSNDDQAIVFLVRPDGTHRHRSPAQSGFAWSSDGKRLAYAVGGRGEDVGIVGVEGRGRRRLHLSGLALITDLMWSPDARRLVLAARAQLDDPDQLWIVGADGKGLRRLTSRGRNDPFGWTRLAPVRPEAPPVPAAERVTAANTVATTAPVAALSADGPNVAFVVHERKTDCDHVAVWAPGETSIRRIGPLPAPCPGYRFAVDEVALAGTRVAWTVDDGGSDCQIGLRSATFADPNPVQIAAYKCSASDFHVRGDGDLLVFDNGPTLERIGGGHESCQPGFEIETATICTTLRSGDHSAPVDSVSGGLIAIREPGDVAVVDEGGRLVRDFPFAPADVSAARLDGGKLVVWRFGVLEVYDVATGARELTRPMPIGYRLADVDGGVAVLLSTSTIELLRLADGGSRTLTRDREPTLADLEPTGLYYSYATADGGGRIVFVPRSELFPTKRLLTAAPAARRSWIVFGSDRDGEMRAYSVRSDGSRLTPLFARSRTLEPIQVSADGGTVLYGDATFSAFFVSRADGTGLHRVPGGLFPSLSRNGKLVAFGRSGAIWIVGSDGRGLHRAAAGDLDESPDWSPDGKALAFVTLKVDRTTLVVQRLEGSRSVLARGGSADELIARPSWSPDGRSVAYYQNGIWVVRPDGSHRRRLARGDTPFAWSPDGTRIAFTSGHTGIALVAPGGRGLRRLPAGFPEWIGGLAWSPDGRRLAVQSGLGDPKSQIFVVGADGRGRRLVARNGTNRLAGWTHVAPARTPAPPLLPSERVLGPRTVATKRTVSDLSADGSRVAFAVGSTSVDCDHVVVWTPGSKALVRFRRPAPCGPGNDAGSIYDVELAGSRAAWSSITSCGNTCEVLLSTATLGRRSPVGVADGAADANDELPDFHARGHGDLLVFGDGSRLERIGVGREGCAEHGDYSPRMCTTLRRGAHAAAADSVSGRLIAIREPDAVSILDDQGKLVRVFPFGTDEVERAVLDGDRLVVARGGVLEVYDARSGRAELQRTAPAGYRLTDADGGVAVLVSRTTIVLRRLADGRTTTLKPGRGPVFAELEPQGLYYSNATAGGGGRVVFVPRAEIVRRLGGSAR